MIKPAKPRNLSILPEDKTKIVYQKSSKIDKNNSICVVFLHGLGGSLTSWTNVNQYLDVNCDKIYIDLRGHGLSDRPKQIEQYNIDALAHDVELIVELQAQDKTIVLVGHCLGGLVAQQVIARSKIKVDRLMLINTAYKNLAWPVWVCGLLQKLAIIIPPVHLKQRADIAKFAGTANISLPRLISDISHTSLTSYLMLLIESLKVNYSTLLPSITCPTLIVYGEEDIFTKKKDVEFFTNNVTTARKKTIQSNHISVINHPSIIANLVNDFVNQLHQ